MTCPVLGSCYKQLQKYYFPTPYEVSPTAQALRPPSETFVEYDELLPAWEAIDEEVHREEASASTRRLRAFFALELVYYCLIPERSHVVDKVDFKATLRLQRLRDHQGLEDLITACEKLQRTIVMRRGHTELLGKERNPAFELMAASLRSAGSRVEGCKHMAMALRSTLDGDEREIGCVGRIFGELLVSFKIPLEESIKHLRTMLSISLTNPVSPWNQSTAFQV